MATHDTDTIARLKEALDDEDVHLAYVFGSVARNQTHPGSDVDVAIRSGQRLDLGAAATLARRLEVAVGRPVDLVDLDRAPPLLLREVLAVGEPIVVRDPDEQADFEARAMARYLDTAYLRRIQHEYLRERSEARRAPES